MWDGVGHRVAGRGGDKDTAWTGWEAWALLPSAALRYFLPGAGNEARAVLEGGEGPLHPEQLPGTCFTYGVVFRIHLTRGPIAKNAAV